MNKDSFLKSKIKELRSEGYTTAQAKAIADSISRKQETMQIGGRKAPSLMNNYSGNPFSSAVTSVPETIGYDPGNPNISLQPGQEPSAYDKTNMATEDLKFPSYFQVPPGITAPETEYTKYLKGVEQPQKEESKVDPNSRVSLNNNYGGISLEDSIALSGKSFGEGNTGMGVMGASLSALKGFRGFMSGYANGKESKRSLKEGQDELYNPKINYQYGQQGGKHTYADMITGQYRAEEGQGNMNVEGEEYIKSAATGQVQEVVGEKHIKNGKRHDGVNVNLQDGDKVLSDYTKIPTKVLKDINKTYNLNLKAGVTFAEAQKSFDKKIGVKKTTDEMSQVIEKLGENEAVEDATTKRLNEIALSGKIESYKSKLDTLKQPQADIFDTLFEEQEKIPKKGKPGELLDKKGNPIEEEVEDSFQQGGMNIEALAKEYGISVERAHELLSMQEGGEQEQGQQADPQQMMAQIAEALQQGADPQELMQQLVESGVDEQSATQMIQSVMQQMQSEPQEVAQEGVNSTKILDFEKDPRTDKNLPYTPRENSINDIWKGDNYGKDWMPFVEEAMKDPTRVAQIESWLLSTENKFAPNVKTQLEGLEGEARTARIKQLATDGKPGLFHNAFLDAVKKTEETPEAAPEKKVEDVAAIEEEVKKDFEGDTTEKITPWMPKNIRLAPSSLDPIAKEQISLGRAEAVKQSAEPYLAEQERARQLEVERVQQSGLSPEQQEAILAQGLSSSQSAYSDVIGKVSQFNVQSKYGADQFNIGQRAKEDITNSQYNQQYQNMLLQGKNNTERDWRNYFTEGNLQNNQNFKDIENINLLNAQQDQYAYVPGEGIKFLNNKSTDLSATYLTRKEVDNMTVEEIEAKKKEVIDKANKEFAEKIKYKNRKV